MGATSAQLFTRNEGWGGGKGGRQWPAKDAGISQLLQIKWISRASSTDQTTSMANSKT